MYMLDSLFSLTGVLLSVAFFTLMERKIMGMMHYRKGPNKIIMAGLTQPLADALKLLTKEAPKPSLSKTMMFKVGPMLMMASMMMCWIWYESSMSNNMSSSMKMVMILTIMSTSAYSFILMSWGSNSKYAVLGGLRTVAQIVSYEVCLALFVITLVFMMKTMSLVEMKMMQTEAWVAAMMTPLFLMWMLLCLAESNRTPFDLAEGESEIVSGFNIEYGGGLFALIFISEYGMIMFLSFLSACLFFGGSSIMKMMAMNMIFVWVRSSFPRVRYDSLMMTSWKMVTPYSMAMILMSTCCL